MGSDKRGKYPVICAWCGKHIGAKNDMRGASHSVCKKCKEEVKKVIKKRE